MPGLHFRLLPDSPAAFSIEISGEGVFLFLWPFELALTWPGVQA